MAQEHMARGEQGGGVRAVTECEYDVIQCDVCGGSYDAPHQPPKPSTREAQMATLLSWMVHDYHQTGFIRDHVDPNAKGWEVNRDWRICEDSLCVATRDILG